MNRIIVINGYAGAGKSTFVSFCKEIAGPHGINVEELSMADPAKQLCIEGGEWDGVSKTDKDRLVLHHTKLMLDKYGDVNMKYIKRELNNFNVDTYNVVFIHAREPKDIERLVNEYKAVTLFISSNLEQLTHGNDADDNVTAYDYDFFISADMGDLSKLKLEAKKFIANVFNTESEEK